MSSTAAAELASSKPQTPEEVAMNDPDDMEPNHDLPARTAADDENREHSQQHNDDPATMAASEELKHTTISDRIANHSRVEVTEKEPEPVEEADKDMGGIAKASTPEQDLTEAQDEEMRERLSSPKKKRGRDQDEDASQLDEENADGPGSSADGSVVNGGRSTRTGPEKKKRARDTSEEFSKSADEAVGIRLEKTPAVTTKTSALKSQTQEPKSVPEKTTEDKPQTSSTAFASSGFASLAGSTTSGFGSLGASKPSVFGGTLRSTTSGFGALSSAKSPSTTTTTTTTTGFGALAGGKPSTGFSFGSGTVSGFGSGTSSGFGGLASGSVFGSKLGNGFAGGAGPKLSSFAAPGAENKIIGTKPAKAFGAPESEEEEEGSDEEDSEGGGDDEDEEANVGTEEKKKAKISKVHIDDGEAGEVTLLQLRAKLFAIESKETGWKERGVGTLKINVPRSCASFDENGVAISGSFDPSGLEDEDEEPDAPRVPRLIMRQENTHRVILNTIIVRGMEFQDKPSASTAQILFTAFEGEKELKPINMLLKLSEANAKLFRTEIDSIKREL